MSNLLLLFIFQYIVCNKFKIKHPTRDLYLGKFGEFVGLIEKRLAGVYSAEPHSKMPGWIFLNVEGLPNKVWDVASKGNKITKIFHRKKYVTYKHKEPKKEQAFQFVWLGEKKIAIKSGLGDCLGYTESIRNITRQECKDSKNFQDQTFIVEEEEKDPNRNKEAEEPEKDKNKNVDNGKNIFESDNADVKLHIESESTTVSEDLKDSKKDQDEPSNKNEGDNNADLNYVRTLMLVKKDECSPKNPAEKKNCVPSPGKTTPVMVPPSHAGMNAYPKTQNSPIYIPKNTNPNIPVTPSPIAPCRRHVQTSQNPYCNPPHHNQNIKQRCV